MTSVRSKTPSWSIPYLLFLFFYKLYYAVYRLIRALRLLPVRLGRLLVFTVRGFRFRGQPGKWDLEEIKWWWLQWTLLLFEVAALPEVYETLADWIKWNSRPLHQWEQEVLESVFGDALEYHRIRLDERAFLGPRTHRICYVSFYTINSWGGMPNALLIHEAMHIWQYQQLGILYIPLALRAQRSKAGYDYGGWQQLQLIQHQGGTIWAFNLEQQADICADYYRLKEGYPVVWGATSPDHLPVYAYFIRQLQGGKDAPAVRPFEHVLART